MRERGGRVFGGFGFRGTCLWGVARRRGEVKGARSRFVGETEKKKKNRPNTGQRR